MDDQGSLFAEPAAAVRAGDPLDAVNAEFLQRAKLLPQFEGRPALELVDRLLPEPA